MGSWTCVAQNVKGPLVDLNGYHSNQAGECILKITDDQVFSLDDVIARTKPIYRYKETGHPSLQAPKIHALRDEFINLGFVRPSTSLREEISWHDFFQVASFNAVEASKWQDYMSKGLQCHAVFVLMPINRINSNWSQPRGHVYWNTRHNRTVYQYANFLSHWVHSHFTL